MTMNVASASTKPMTMKPIHTSCQPTWKLSAGSITHQVYGFGPERRPGHADCRASSLRRTCSRWPSIFSTARPASLTPAGGEVALGEDKAAGADHRDSERNGLTGPVAVEQQPGDQCHQGIRDVIGRDHRSDIVAAIGSSSFGEYW